jgi:threonine/homoserine/homoserine lactone efflux protein
MIIRLSQEFSASETNDREIQVLGITTLTMIVMALAQALATPAFYLVVITCLEWFGAICLVFIVLLCWSLGAISKDADRAAYENWKESIHFRKGE